MRTIEQITIENVDFKQVNVADTHVVLTTTYHNEEKDYYCTSVMVVDTKSGMAESNVVKQRGEDSYFYAFRPIYIGLCKRLGITPCIA